MRIENKLNLTDTNFNCRFILFFALPKHCAIKYSNKSNLINATIFKNYTKRAQKFKFSTYSSWIMLKTDNSDYFSNSEVISISQLKHYLV